MKIAVLITVSLFFTGCHSISQPVQTSTEHWQSLYPGIDYAAANLNDPRPQQVHVVRIDLTNSHISFYSTPDNGRRPLMTDGQKTSEFLKKYHCKIAINANPFSPVDETHPRDIHGLAISNGQIVSKPNIANPSLLITKDNIASIAYTDENTDLRDVWTAISGFNIILSNGMNIGECKTIHPRTAIGISKDYRFLFLMVIDGRQPHYSEGATFSETAKWLQRFGAYNGLNLDGGGSSTLVRSDNNGGAFILNRPIHNNKHRNERIVGNNFGVIVTAQNKSVSW